MVYSGAGFKGLAKDRDTGSTGYERATLLLWDAYLAHVPRVRVVSWYPGAGGYFSDFGGSPVAPWWSDRNGTYIGRCGTSRPLFLSLTACTYLQRQKSYS